MIEEVLVPGSCSTGAVAAATILRTPLGRRVKVVEHGTGSAGGVPPQRGRQRWRVEAGLLAVAGWLPARRDRGLPRRHRSRRGRAPEPRRLCRSGLCRRRARRRVGRPGRVLWGGATALRVAAAAPEFVDSLAVIEPEAYALLRTQDADAYTEISGLRDRWRAHVRAGRWYEAYEEFIDFYNGPGSFARWPPQRREAFLAVQQTRGDLWDVLFDGLLTLDALAG